MANLALGTLIDGRYEIESSLSEGGFGLVYVARDLRLDKRLAVKILKPEFCEHASVRPRFEREAKILAALTHPNIVLVTDFGVHDDCPYLVMELLSGCTLRALLDQGLPAEATVTDVMTELLQGLAHAHAQGVVHRDLKPGNIFLEEHPVLGRRVKILDFGFAKPLAPEFEASTGGKLTVAGVTFGTPAYVAPEQITLGATDARTDVYGAAIVLFEMLAGAPPFQGEPRELLRKQVVEPAPGLESVRPEARPRPELQALLARALSKRPADRFADAGELADALQEVPRPWLLLAHAPPPASVALPSPESEPLASTQVYEPRPLAVPPTPWRPIAWGRDAVIEPAWAWLSERFSAAVAFVAPRVTSALDALRRAPRRVLWGGTLATLVVLGLVLWRLTHASGTEPLPPTSARATPTAPPPRATRGDPDPWLAAPVPPLLSGLRARLARGEAPGAAEEQALRRFAESHRSDARPELLLAYLYMRRHWRADALKHYELALRASPTARGDRRMLHDLVDLAKGEELGARAGALVQRVYGSDAIDAVDAALRRERQGSAARQRLARLRGTLNGPSH